MRTSGMSYGAFQLMQRRYAMEDALICLDMKQSVLRSQLTSEAITYQEFNDKSEALRQWYREKAKEIREQTPIISKF